MIGHPELERLQAALSSRQSPLHFAHAGVSFILGLLLGGAAAKALWDRLLPAGVGYGLSLGALACLAYSSGRFGMGRRCLRRELEQFESLKALRRALKLDDPSSLLPR